MSEYLFEQKKFEKVPDASDWRPPEPSRSKSSICAVTRSLYKNGVFLGLLAWKKIGWTFFHPSNPKKSSFFESKCRKLQFLKLSKKSYFWVVFLTKTTVLTSILTSEVTDMVPQPQFELGKVPETQSGTWGNLVPHMCKSQQTTSVNRNISYAAV